MASEDPATGDPRLLDLADSISSGAAVDWEAAERSASSDEERRMLRQLRILAGIMKFVIPAFKKMSCI